MTPDTYPRDIVYPAQARVAPAHIPATVDPLSLDAMKYVRSTLEVKDNRVRVIILWYVIIDDTFDILPNAVGMKVIHIIH
jgi:hypothetical protein